MFKTSISRLRSGLQPRRVAPEDAASHLFLAPPFDERMAGAARLISTKLSIKADEESRLLWQAEANQAAMVEYNALRPLFAAMEKPRKVLEIGPGLGRSVVVFSKLKVWEKDAAIHIYDTDGRQTKYKQEHYSAPPKWPDVSSFCGNLSILREVLAFNGVSNFTVFDAAQTPLSKLPGPYDLIYGFYSVGFHWSLEYYLDDIGPLMKDRTVLVCTLNKHFAPFPRLKNFSARILQSKELKKGSRPLSFLAISKGELPQVGASISDVYGG
jgi:hypothetical protein